MNTPLDCHPGTIKLYSDQLSMANTAAMATAPGLDWRPGRLFGRLNPANDSSQPAICKEDRLPLRTIRKFCTRTTREMAVERGGFFAGVEHALQRRRQSTSNNERRNTMKWD